MIPYGRQHISNGDIQAVTKVLGSDFLTQGPIVPQFERSIASYCGADYAVATNSATSALHLSCLALDLGPGDTLWTSPNSFVASANCAVYCGAEVNFVDIDSSTYNLCARKLEEKLEASEKTGDLPKVIVVVHFAGQSCEMKKIAELGKKYRFRIIEDASHAIGAEYAHSKVGSCRYSDVTVFSFHPVKIITTAEGGLAATNDPELASRMSRMRSHGITRDQSEMVNKSDGPWYYEQIELGLNYRMTDLHAALGLSQLARLDEFVTKRHQIADLYDSEFGNSKIKLPVRSNSGRSALHLYPIQVSCDRKKVFCKLRDAGIGVNVHYIPIHLQPFYQKRGFTRGDFPVAENYYDNAISLPMFSSLESNDQEFVIKTLKSLIEDSVN